MTYLSGNLTFTVALTIGLLSPTLVASQQTGEPSTETRRASPASESTEARLFKLSQALLQDPQNPTLLLQKGVLLSEMGQIQAAFDVFNALRQAFPHHPAPYANLASLLARQGRLEEARQMLLKADEAQANKYQTQLSLASVNLELALSALNKANQLNPGDKATEARLRMLEKYLADVNKGGFSAAIASSGTKLTEASVAPSGVARTSRNPTSSAKTPRDRLLLGLMDPRDDAGSLPSSGNETSGPLQMRASDDPRKAEVLKTIEHWVSAWTQKSFEEYTDLYSTQFVSADGAPRDDWAKRKRLLWDKTKSIQVELKISGIRFNGPKATVLLSQKYNADRYSDFSRKELQLVQEDGRWKILSEKKRP